MRFGYQENAYREAELDVEIDPDVADPLGAMTEVQIDELHERVIRADSLMKLVDDEDDGFAVQLDLFDLQTKDCFDLDLIDNPRAVSRRQACIQPIELPTIRDDELRNPLAERLDELNSDPMFAMSLGGKELFHSNFLKWVLESILPSRETVCLFLDCLGINLDPSMPFTIHRERNSFDLALVFDQEHLIVIENKFKSLPDRLQLQTYAQDATNLANQLRANRERRITGKRGKKGPNAVPHLVLLSPSKPVWLDELTAKWNYLSYERLFQFFRSVASRGNGFDTTVIGRYCKMTERLLDLRQICSATENSMFFPGPNRILLQEYRLHDLVFKWRFSELAQRVSEQIRDRLYFGDPTDFYFRPSSCARKPMNVSTEFSNSTALGVNVSTGFSNSMALVDLFVQAPYLEVKANGKKYNDEEVPLVGIQLQHNYLRFAIRNVPEEQAKYLLRSPLVNEILSKLDKSDKIKLVRSDREEQDFYNFGPWFKHRFRTLDETVEVSVDDLACFLVAQLDAFITACAESHSKTMPSANLAGPVPESDAR